MILTRIIVDLNGFFRQSYELSILGTEHHQCDWVVQLATEIGDGEIGDGAQVSEIVGLWGRSTYDAGRGRSSANEIGWGVWGRSTSKR